MEQREEKEIFSFVFCCCFFGDCFESFKTPFSIIGHYRLDLDIVILWIVWLLRQERKRIQNFEFWISCCFSF